MKALKWLVSVWLPSPNGSPLLDQSCVLQLVPFSGLAEREFTRTSIGSPNVDRGPWKFAEQNVITFTLGFPTYRLGVAVICPATCATGQKTITKDGLQPLLVVSRLTFTLPGALSCYKLLPTKHYTPCDFSIRATHTQNRAVDSFKLKLSEFLNRLHTQT